MLGALLKWLPKLPRLRSMNLWNGEALRDTGSLIRSHCHSFAELKFWGWYCLFSYEVRLWH